MAPTNPATRDIPSDDELDALLNLELGVQDLSATFSTQAQQDGPRQQKSTNTTATLGIDKEIEVDQVKKRIPIPKLDSTRLLSAAGIPKLRRISKERLNFKGKGHEYGDIARMLNMYQLWLDDLYPRAKFADGLAMIEKLGHSKTIQYQRKAWIAEGKPTHATESDFEESVIAIPEQATEEMEGIEGDTTSRENGLQNTEGDNGPHQTEPLVPAPEDAPDEDELAALLAESDMPSTSLTSTTLRPKAAAPQEDLFEDDLEAMAEMEGMW